MDQRNKLCLEIMTIIYRIHSSFTVCSVCAYVCMCIYEHVCICVHGGQRLVYDILNYSPSDLFDTGSLIGPGTQHLARLSNQ